MVRAGFARSRGIRRGFADLSTGFQSVRSARVCLRGRFGGWSSTPCRANRGCRRLKLFNVPHTARSSLRIVLTTQSIGLVVLQGLFAHLDDLELAFRKSAGGIGSREAQTTSLDVALVVPPIEDSRMAFLRQVVTI